MQRPLQEWTKLSLSSISKSADLLAVAEENISPSEAFTPALREVIASTASLQNAMTKFATSKQHVKPTFNPPLLQKDRQMSVQTKLASKPSGFHGSSSPVSESSEWKWQACHGLPCEIKACQKTSTVSSGTHRWHDGGCCCDACPKYPDARPVWYDFLLRPGLLN